MIIEDEKLAKAAAMYLAGHGSLVRPRLIELQYRRIQRYRAALSGLIKTTLSPRDVYVDLRLPKYGAGIVDMRDIPAFERLRRRISSDMYEIVFMDIDEIRVGLTPDYESAFVRERLERAGARVLNSFIDDDSVLEKALKARFGNRALADDVTDGSDMVCFFPSLASEITSAALRRELQDATALESIDRRRIDRRIEALRRLRPYSGGGTPFVEDRLHLEWRKLA